MEKESDVQLIQRILSGDEAAFDVLVQRHKKSVHALAWRKIGDFHDAEEITQDTFLQVYKRLPTLKDPYKFAGWLYVIANRLCIDRMRQKNLTIQSLEDTPVEEVEKSSYTHHVSEQQQTEITERRRAIVKKLLEKLPESERTVMTLFYLGEMTVKEISKFLGVSASAIHNRLYRARKRLQEEEALLVQEVLSGVQIPVSVSQNIMRRVADTKPLPQTPPKPVIPWIAFGTAFLLLTLLSGTSNQYLTRFQKPYSFEATSEPTITIIEAPVVLETDAKPALRNQVGRTTALDKRTGAGLQGSETISTTGSPAHPENIKEWMPDENLRRAIKSELKLGDIPLEIAHLQQLVNLVSIGEGIESIAGLEHAVNLRFLHLAPSDISDLTPLAGLENLRILKLYGNRISDLTPLAGLIHLEALQLQVNQISDISPLAGLIGLQELNLGDNLLRDISQLQALVNLKTLRLRGNQILDFTPLLNLTQLESLDIHYNLNSGEGQFVSADPAIIEALRVTIGDFERPQYVRPVKERIENREYPSVFVGYSFTFRNKMDLAPLELISLTDLSFNINPLEPLSYLNFGETALGVARIGDITNAKKQHAAVLRENPNRIFLVEIAYFDGRQFGFTEDSPYWLRNSDGTIAQRQWTRDAQGKVYLESLVDFTQLEVQELIIAQAVAVAKCGLYDGISLNRWHRDLEDYFPEDIEMAARDKILHGIRAAVPEDFLITVTTREKIPRWKKYINGVYVKTPPTDGREFYTAKAYRAYEEILQWYEANLREPQITLLRGEVKAYRDPMSAIAQRHMRALTTLSLTHSDGYILMSGTMPKPEGIWYDFFDAPLGRPVGGDETKGQLYRGRKGLFIREFTNGWAVYNRSGKAQQIQLIESATGVASRITGISHIVPDLDGEIFVK